MRQLDVLSGLYSEQRKFSPSKSNSLLHDDLVLRALVHEAHDGLDVDHAGVGKGGGECEALEEPGEKEKYLVVSQLLTQAVSLPHQEGNASLLLPEQPSLGVQEPLRFELFRLLPVVWVVHDPGDVGVDRGACRDVVAVEDDVLRGGVGDGIGEAGVSQDLVDDGLHVRHLRSVLQHCTPTPHH